MNKLGKLFVLLNLAFSLLSMAFALAIYFQFVDWGFKEPRKDKLDYRVASEFDKRYAAIVQAQGSAQKVLGEVRKAQADLALAAVRFPTNHLFYVRELDRLRNDPGESIEIKEIKFEAKELVLDVPIVGKPLLEDAVAGISKSYVAYLGDLKKTQDEIEKVTDQIAALIKAEKDLSDKLLGIKGKPGLNDLVESEKALQDQIKYEKEYVQPLWVSAIREVEIFRERRLRLEATLEKLKKFQEK